MSKRRAKAAPRRADDFPEIPGDLLARMKPSKRGRPTQGDAPKQSIALRVDRDVLAAFKAQGPGWQTRMQATLKRAANRLSRVPRSRKRG
ncbi:MAG: BrnA antitoxin family protein [Hyphomonadaceae bacterium]